MFKILLALLILLSIVTVTTLGSSADRKSDLSLGLSQECEVVDYRIHNYFSIVYLACEYDDGILSGTLKNTLFLSPRGYVIKAGRGYGNK